MLSLKLLSKIDDYIRYKIESGEKLPYGLIGLRSAAIWNYIVYGTSFSEFFAYRFYAKTRKEKLEYMTRRHMFKFYDKYNPVEFRLRIGDKRLTKNYYGHFMKREQFNFSDGFEAFKIFCNKYQTIFIKNSIGWGGTDAYKADVSSDYKIFKVWKMLSSENVIEPALINCKELYRLNPTSLNTIKVTTLFLEDGPKIQTALFRCGIGTQVDNVHSGGMCALIDLNTGSIITEAIDNKFRHYIIHPLTLEQITGLTIPYWENVKELSLAAAKVSPQIRYASWDIAVLEDGPVLIEGNWDAEFYAEQMLLGYGVRNIYIDKLEGKC